MSWTEEDKLNQAKTQIACGLKAVKPSKLFKVMIENDCDIIEAKRIIKEMAGDTE